MKGLRAVFAILLLIPAEESGARLLMSQKDALGVAFAPGVAVERRTAYLSEEQVREIETLARAKLGSRVWTYYVGASSAGIAGYAYFETHVVRSMTETFMAALNPDGSVRFVEILAFAEPEDYRPRPRWLEQFQGRSLKDDLMVHRAIRNITGASLTSEALTTGLRRVLAVHAFLHPRNRILSPIK